MTEFIELEDGKLINLIEGAWCGELIITRLILLFLIFAASAVLLLWFRHQLKRGARI